LDFCIERRNREVFYLYVEKFKTPKYVLLIYNQDEEVEGVEVVPFWKYFWGVDGYKMLNFDGLNMDDLGLRFTRYINKLDIQGKFFFLVYNLLIIKIFIRLLK